MAHDMRALQTAGLFLRCQKKADIGNSGMKHMDSLNLWAITLTNPK